MFTTLTSYGSFATTNAAGVVNTISVLEFTVVDAALTDTSFVPIHFTIAPAWKFVPVTVIVVPVSAAVVGPIDEMVGVDPANGTQSPSL